MDNQKNQNRSNHPNCVPARVANLDPVEDQHMEGIVPHLDGKIEGYVMFDDILSCFLRIPSELQSILACSMYVQIRKSQAIRDNLTHRT